MKMIKLPILNNTAETTDDFIYLNTDHIISIEPEGVDGIYTRINVPGRSFLIPRAFKTILKRLQMKELKSTPAPVPQMDVEPTCATCANNDPDICNRCFSHDKWRR
jgi:hypothetical protein